MERTPNKPRYFKKSRTTIHVGARFGLLVVREDLGTFRSSAAANPKPVYSRRFLCDCDCGGQKETWGNHLRSNIVTSCGCAMKGATPRLKNGEAAVRMVLRAYEANAKNRGIVFALTREQMLPLMQACCFYCGISPSLEVRTKGGEGSFIYNGIDRVDNSQGYTFENVVTCCKTCNLAKKDMTPQAFLAWVERVFTHSVAHRVTLQRVG